MGKTRLLTAGAAAIAAWTLPTGAAYSAAAPLLGMHRHIRTPGGQPRAALTFDDGPHPVGTPLVLTQLQRLGIRATFFMVGEQVERFPDVARLVASAGHEIENHGYRHVNHLYRSPLGLADDIERGAAAIEDAVGVRPTLYRPPQGAVTPVTIVAARRGSWPIVLWSTWGRDWRASATPGTIARDALARLADGGIVLLHDADHYSAPGSHRHTAAALESIVEAASLRGIDLTAAGGRSNLA